jgi:ribosomal protein S18 acetylase RimI-like enzyme
MADLRLSELTSSEYEHWWDLATRDYAQEHVKSGNWTAGEAVEKSVAEFRKLLPEGTRTPGHYLYALEDPQTKDRVGILWFRADKGPDAPQPPVVFIYDLRVDEKYRGKGYGARAMGLAEMRARELGFDTVSLHVFGHNKVARGLYEKLGYVATNLLMSKKLGPTSGP